jgi:primosomal protein N' (replication factor Y) (superfamily II helicase)
VGKGKFTLLELPDRVEGRPLPKVDVVDLRRGGRPGYRRRADAGGRAVPEGHARGRRFPGCCRRPSWRPSRDRLERDEQTILLLNRRGYASFVQCRDCGHVWQCQRCNVSLTYHRPAGGSSATTASTRRRRPERCEECASESLSFRGLGTEQVERIVAETFPTARVARMDVDTTSGKWSHHEILGRVERREVDILLGTQMIAKGLDFPNVTLVGVINADVGMNLPDFRAGERTFQLLTQVAGRAGRGSRPGQVLVQTALPGHYAVQRALEHDYLGFAERELEERRDPAYPPHTRLANVVVSGTDEVKVQEAAESLAEWTAQAVRRLGPGAVGLLGPAPCAIDRIRDRWRWHFLLRSGSAGKLGAVCRALYAEHGTGSGAIRVIVDRDPVALL